jgi:hypothetical protein
MSTPRDEGGAFASELAALKRDGAAFLVAGDVPVGLHADASDRLLGAERADRRVVVDGGDADPPTPAPGTDLRLLRYRGAVRSGTEAEGVEHDPGTVVTDLPELGTAVLDAVEAYEVSTPEPEPGGLRVAVLTAAPLVAACGEESVFAVLHLLTNRVREPDGLTFVHLPAARGSEVAATFRPLFDGVVELRVAEGRSQQRWHLAETSSDWLDC